MLEAQSCLQERNSQGRRQVHVPLQPSRGARYAQYLSLSKLLGALRYCLALHTQALTLTPITKLPRKGCVVDMPFILKMETECPCPGELLGDRECKPPGMASTGSGAIGEEAQEQGAFLPFGPWAPRQQGLPSESSVP